MRYILFLEVAFRATFKLAAQLDLCVQKGILETASAQALKRPLVRVASMTAAMRQKD